MTRSKYVGATELRDMLPAGLLLVLYHPLLCTLHCHGLTHIISYRFGSDAALLLLLCMCRWVRLSV
jgi:hypothetical protein